MTWGKLAGFCSLKAIAVACCITPVTVPATGITAAHAQFNIIIPGFGIPHYGGRRYYRSRGYYRSARRGGRRGGSRTRRLVVRPVGAVRRRT